jgi:energy-coupling factor transporter ATP-binding protein EcfA2
MNAVTFVAYCGELCGPAAADAMQRAHEVLYYVGLGEARYRNIEQYSTGMKQRIKLAQALVHDPSLLFLDEPTNGMDPKGRDEMLELIRDIAHNKQINLIPLVAPAARRRVHMRPRRRARQGRHRHAGSHCHAQGPGWTRVRVAA